MIRRTARSAGFQSARGKGPLSGETRSQRIACNAPRRLAAVRGWYFPG